MARVHFTPHLARYFPELAPLEVPSRTVAELVGDLDARYRGLAAYLVDDRGALRQHVVVFVDKVAVRDRERLSDAVAPHSEVHVFQALSGG
jgi:molybdopterin synthase sulfur carrier subunit